MFAARGFGIMIEDSRSCDAELSDVKFETLWFKMG
jgi:hypothetical protein